MSHSERVPMATVHWPHRSSQIRTVRIVGARIWDVLDFLPRSATSQEELTIFASPTLRPLHWYSVSLNATPCIWSRCMWHISLCYSVLHLSTKRAVGTHSLPSAKMHIQHNRAQFWKSTYHEKCYSARGASFRAFSPRYIWLCYSVLHDIASTKLTVDKRSLSIAVTVTERVVARVGPLLVLARLPQSRHISLCYFVLHIPAQRVVDTHNAY